MSNNIPHYRPFNHEHARAGAPFSTIDGRSVEIIRWDVRGGDCPLLGIVENGAHGQLVVRWTTDGVQYAERTADEQLVMTSLGMCDGKPVFWDSEMEHEDGTPVAGHVAAFHSADGFNTYRWPSQKTGKVLMTVTMPEMECTLTGFTMFGKEYVQVELLGVVAEAVYRDMQSRARTEVDAFGGIHVCMPRSIDIPAIVKRVREGK